METKVWEKIFNNAINFTVLNANLDSQVTFFINQMRERMSGDIKKNYKYSHFKNLDTLFHKCPSIMDIYNVETACYLFAVRKKFNYDYEIAYVQDCVDYLRLQRISESEIAECLCIDLARMRQLFNMKKIEGNRKITLDQEVMTFNYLANSQKFYLKSEVGEDLWSVWLNQKSLLFEKSLLSEKSQYTYFNSMGIVSPELPRDSIEWRYIYSKSNSNTRRNSVYVWVKIKKVSNQFYGINQFYDQIVGTHYYIIYGVRANGSFVFSVARDLEDLYTITTMLLEKCISIWADKSKRDLRLILCDESCILSNILSEHYVGKPYKILYRVFFYAMNPYLSDDLTDEVMACQRSRLDTFVARNGFKK